MSLDCKRIEKQSLTKCPEGIGGEDKIPAELKTMIQEVA